MNDPDVEHVIELETRALTSEGRHDPLFLDEILADGYVECGASGRLQTKSDILRELSRETGVVFRVVGSIEPEQVSDDVIRTMFVVVREADGVEMTSRRFSLWRRTGGMWKIVYHQGTPISD
jgi:hypothetical protein